VLRDAVSVSKRPAFWVVGQAGDKVKIALADANKVSLEQLKNMQLSKVVLASAQKTSDFEKIDLGSITIDDGYKGVLVPDFDLPDGKYYIIAKGQKGIGQLSTIKIDSTQVMQEPYVKAFNQGKRTDCNTEITFDWSSFAPKANVNCSFVEEEEAATLTLQTPPGIVNMTWHSLILNSVIISDKSQEIAIKVPKNLPEGDHEVIGFVEDPLTGLRSEIFRYIFSITR